MDGLKSLSQSIFDSNQKFKGASTANLYKTFECTPGNSKDANLSESRIPQWLSQSEDAYETVSENNSRNLRIRFKHESQDPRIRLIRISRDIDVSLEISEATFRSIFESMRADPAALYLVCHDYDGFHEFNNKDEHTQYLPTRFVGNEKFALIWTFNPAVFSTSVVFINRRSEVFSDFCKMITDFTEYNTGHLITFVSSLFQVHLLDKETGEIHLPTLRAIEGNTGYGPNREDAPRLGSFWGTQKISQSQHGIETLTDWSQQVGEIAGQLGNKSRHQRVSSHMLKALLHTHSNGSESNRFIDRHAVSRNRQSLKSLADAVPIVEKQISTASEFLTYLKDRSEKLSGVLFALLTHEDAVAGVALAVKAKKDSSSMKTVAVMTMAFLPATFFAALFAVPSLKWGQSQVIQSDFWIYLAFTLPVTAMVFAIWFGLTYARPLPMKAPK